MQRSVRPPNAELEDPTSVGVESPAPVPAEGFQSDAGRVLLVDDDEAVLRALSRALARGGFVIETATSVREGLDAFSARHFDAIVSDIAMPGADGIAFAEQVRHTDTVVPLILITGHPTLETAVRAVEHGVHRYLRKPIDIVELRTVVSDAVAKCRSLRSDDAIRLETEQRRVRELAVSQVEVALQSLWMAYQPIFREQHGDVVGYEALLRVRDAIITGPGEMLSVAERGNRLHRLGRAVRARVARELELAPPAATVFLNLHPLDLGDPELFDPSSPLAAVADRVVLEVTERAPIAFVGDLDEQLAALRQLGYRLALDDLGAGHAGLALFARLEPEIVKFDMALVRDAHLHQTKARLLRGLVEACHDVGALCVAEGIEKQEEYDLLSAMGCDLFQGFLLARPGPPFPLAASP